LFVVALAWQDLSTGTRPGTAPKPPGLKLLASKNDTRAWPSGFGYAKVGANYGPAFVSHMEGRKRVYEQILWLFGEDYTVRRRISCYGANMPKFTVADLVESQVTEAGASNFVVWKTREERYNLLQLPSTTKSFLTVSLDGVFLTLQRRLVEGSRYLTSDVKDLEVVEKHYTMVEVEEACKEGRLVEVFLSGTAVSFATFNVT